MENHKERSTFEEFSAHVFAPVLPPQSTLYTFEHRHAACMFRFTASNQYIYHALVSEHSYCKVQTCISMLNGCASDTCVLLMSSID